MSLAPGSRLASYEIVSLLGSGGMGEVYKAKDLKLGRFVAIKVLPEEHAGDAERLKRFEQEARSASALDHPNIITIHDIDEDAGTHFIVMQYVEGKTLRELAGTLELSQTLDYGEQIADGLARAHSHGIVHRDLKPANIMMTEDGLVKILDFGLAKLTEASELSEDSTRDMELKTKEGHVIGTAPYMSPEQAQGKEIDHRSDIFSFGAVLYEMVTGRRAFQEDSFGGLIAAIIKDEPKSVSAILPSVPLDLERVIHRALRKEPARRYQSVSDLRVELVEIKEGLESGNLLSVDRLPKLESRRRAWLAAAALVLIAVLGVTAWRYLRAPDLPPPRSVPLTSLAGYELHPALSPDGRQVVFAWDGGDGGPLNLYVKLLGEGEPLRLTEGSETDHCPTWSPDGTRVAFLRQTEAGHEVRVVPALGGPESLFATTASVEDGLDWSPDGTWLAFADSESPSGQSGVFLLSTQTGEKRRMTRADRLTRGKTTDDGHPVFSPDGRRVAFIRRPRGSGGVGEVLVQSLDGDEPVQLTSDSWFVWDLDWTADGRELVYSHGRTLATSRLQRVRASRGGSRPLGFGDRARHISVAPSPSGGLMAYSEWLEDTNIWRLPGPSAPESAEPTSFIASTRGDHAPVYSPDGRTIAFVSDRSGAWEIWLSASDGSQSRRLTDQGHAIFPVWSGSGERLAFMSNLNVHVMDVSGGFSMNLTAGSAVPSSFPSWSADGQWIHFIRAMDGSPQVVKMPAEGGEVIPLTHGTGRRRRPFETQDGRVLYFRDNRLWSVPVGGGEETLVLDKPVRFNQWCLWNDHIVYILDEPQPWIETVDMATGATARILELEKTSVFYRSSIAVSPDGRWILFARLDQAGSDLVLVENFR